MSERRELPNGGLQPRSAGDARRYPARTERCLEVRGMLRDHADGDLSPRLQEQVEDHVHQCRDCGLALSRAELEVLRLKEAFADSDRRRVAPSEEFTAAVMARARAELRRTEKSQTTEGFTSKVMRSVKRQVERESRRTGSQRMEGRRGWLRRGALLAAAVLVLSVALVVYAPGGRATHVLVVAATDSWVVPSTGASADPNALGGEALKAGDELPAKASVRTGSVGLVELSLPASDRGAGSQLRLEADSELSLGDPNGVLYLGHGRLAAASGGIVDVHLADGTKVVLEPGASRLEALYYRPFDNDLAQGPDLRVRLVVLRGRAQVWRGGEGTEVIEGRVAYFTTRTPVRQDRAVNDEMLMASVAAGDLARRLAEAARQPPAVEEPWLGRLLHPVTRQPVSGASVWLRSHVGAQTISTDAQGRFRAPDLPHLQDQFVVVTAGATDPSGGSLGHGPWVSTLTGVVAGEAPVELLMAQDRRLSGRLLDQDNRPIPAVRVLPVLVDEALGLVQPLPNLATDLGPDGRFAVAGLPATLPPQVSLVLVALCRDRAPQICFSSQRADGSLRDAALRLSIGVTDPVRLAGLPAGRDLEVLQSVVGLPPQQLFGRRLVTSSPLGEASLHHGAGATLWLLRDDQPPQALVAGADGRLRPRDSVVVPPALVALRRGHEPRLHASAVGQTQRFARVAEVPIERRAGGAGHIIVHQAGAPVQARSGAMVFLSESSVSGSGGSENGGSGSTFLGVYSGGPLPFAKPAGGYSLLALDQGGLGHLLVPAGAELQRQLSIPVQRMTSSLLLSDDLLNRCRSAGGIVHLRWQGEGRQMFLTRQMPLTGSGEFRGLLPGSYEIRFPDGTAVTRVVP